MSDSVGFAISIAELPFRGGTSGVSEAAEEPCSFRLRNSATSSDRRRSASARSRRNPWMDALCPKRRSAGIAVGSTGRCLATSLQAQSPGRAVFCSRSSASGLWEAPRTIILQSGREAKPFLQPQYRGARRIRGGVAPRRAACGYEGQCRIPRTHRRHPENTISQSQTCRPGEPMAAHESNMPVMMH